MTIRADFYTVPAVLTPTVLAEIAHVAGGYTVTRGMGGWLDPDTGKLVEEPEATVTVFVPGHDTFAQVTAFVLLAAGRAGEKTVLVAVDWDTAAAVRTTVLSELSTE